MFFYLPNKMRNTPDCMRSTIGGIRWRIEGLGEPSWACPLCSYGYPFAYRYRMFLEGLKFLWKTAIEVCLFNKKFFPFRDERAVQMDEPGLGCIQR